MRSSSACLPARAADAPVRGRAKRLQMHIFDARLVERSPQRRLGKAGPARQRQGADVDHPLDPRLLQRGEESAMVVAS